MLESLYSNSTRCSSKLPLLPQKQTSISYFSLKIQISELNLNVTEQEIPVILSLGISLWFSIIFGYNSRVTVMPEK